MQEQDVPLCVDLDGTLVHTDLLYESALSLLRCNPLYLLLLPLWLLRGKAHLKREIARRAVPDVTLLPYDARVLAWLREVPARRCVLCSASDQILVDAVAAYIGIFEAAIGSDGQTNLEGARKASALVGHYGEHGFDYVGNAAADLAVWPHARQAIAVNASASVRTRLARMRKVDGVIAPRTRWRRAAIRALRPHQWSKNLLVFVAVVAAHRIFEPAVLFATTLAFLAFCLCASGAYVLNDLLDLDADRRHPRKRQRPFAAGHLSIGAGLIAAPVLMLAAFAVASLLSPGFMLMLSIYAVTTLAYTLAVKRIAMLDVIALAGLYTVRIIAGAVAVPVELSSWLLAFSMFLFLSLAMVKRYAEVHRVASTKETRVAGRGYGVDDLSLIESFGTGSGYLSVLVLAFYINSTKSTELYRHHQLLWLLTPLLLYWISRAWMIARRGDMHDDPVVFALTDRISLVVLVLFAGVIILAI
ncbi:MAG: UbiA family prenyltransferase [Dokdonella sp.]